MLRGPGLSETLCKGPLEEPPGGAILSVRHTVSRHTQLVSIESETWPRPNHTPPSAAPLGRRRGRRAPTPASQSSSAAADLCSPAQMNALQQVTPSPFPSSAPSLVGATFSLYYAAKDACLPAALQDALKLLNIFRFYPARCQPL